MNMLKLYTYKIRTVRQVRDGDTFVCDIDLGFGLTKQVVVRLLDFDAFETRRTHKANNLVLESHEVDSFGRSLGTVWVGEDVAINELMRQYQLRLLEQYRDKARVNSATIRDC